MPQERVEAQTASPEPARVTYHRIYTDANGDSHFDTVMVRKGHVTRNIGDGYATFLAVPVPAA